MKIIDLLNKIANGEEVPKKIKYLRNTWAYDEEMEDYFYEESVSEPYHWLTTDFNRLNDEVEIIEDTSKEIKKLDIGLLPVITTHEHFMENKVELMWDKLNELIDYINRG